MEAVPLRALWVQTPAITGSLWAALVALVCERSAENERPQLRVGCGGASARARGQHAEGTVRNWQSPGQLHVGSRSGSLQRQSLLAAWSRAKREAKRGAKVLAIGHATE